MKRLSIAARSIGRKLGINRVVAGLLRSATYEENFANQLLDAVSPGDVVWDVGANVGYYTIKLAENAGANGKVTAFEPVPASAQAIRNRIGESEVTNIEVMEMAIGDADGTVTMVLGPDECDVTNHISTNAISGDNVIEVVMRTGDSLVNSGDAICPNVIKIDVEGFEAECIKGLRTTLSLNAVRAVFIEIHFGVLESRGMPYAALEIERELEKLGFSVSWLDSSHIAAIRTR